MKDIVFEERTYSEEENVWTYYFTAPASKVLELFPGRYKPEDVVSTELSIEVPCNSKTEYEFGRLDGVVVSISPTSEDEDGCLDYDWNEIDINDSEIFELLENAMRQSFSFEEYWNSGLIIKDLCIPGACPLCDEIKDCIADTTFGVLNSMSESHDSVYDIKRHAKQLYNRTCKGERNEKVKPFKVHISEVLGRTVIILAESKDEAYEEAEELCNAGVIDLNGNDFGSRSVEVLDACVREEFKDYEVYETEEN